MFKLAFVTILLAGLSVRAQDEGPKKLVKNYPKEGVYWSITWLSGHDEATMRNVPIFIAHHKDGSKACETAAEIYRDPKFIEKSRMFVNLPCHEGKGHDVDVMIDGRPHPRCERYIGIKCKDHDNVYLAVSVKIPLEKEVPFRVFLSPEPKELARESGSATLDELIKSMDKALAMVSGEKVHADEWRKYVDLFTEGNTALDAGEWQKAIKAYTAITKFGKDKLKAQGDEGLRKLQVKGKNMLLEAKNQAAKVTDKDYTKVKKAVRKIAADFKGLPVAKEAEEYAKTLRGDN
jgi:hypothetical protein